MNGEILTPENLYLWRDRAEQQAGEALCMAVVREDNPVDYQFWLDHALVQAKVVEALNYLAGEVYQTAEFAMRYL